MNIDISNAHCGPWILFLDHSWLRVVSIFMTVRSACQMSGRMWRFVDGVVLAPVDVFLNESRAPCPSRGERLGSRFERADQRSLSVDSRRTPVVVSMHHFCEMLSATSNRLRVLRTDTQGGSVASVHGAFEICAGNASSCLREAVVGRRNASLQPPARPVWMRVRVLLARARAVLYSSVDWLVDAKTRLPRLALTVALATSPRARSFRVHSEVRQNMHTLK